MAKLKAQLTFRVAEADYDRLQEIAKSERRKMNEVARALLERGLAAYLRDGKIFEPMAENSAKPDERPATIIPRRTYKIGEDAKKKTKAS